MTRAQKLRNIYKVKFRRDPSYEFYKSLCDWGNYRGLTKFITNTPWPPREYYEIAVPTKDLATEAKLRFS